MFHVDSTYLQPYEFWPYTTVVMNRILEYEPAWLRGEGSESSGRQAVDRLREELVARFKQAGINCVVDNKTAFGLRDIVTDRLVYIGFYDGRVSVGYSVTADKWLTPQRKDT